MADRNSRAKLARAAARLNASGPYAGQLPPLILMTDDERLADPLAAARALPKASLVVARSRNAKRRAELAEDLAPIAKKHDLFLLVADDPEMAARVGADGLHLPEARAHDAAHWRARHPRWIITCAAHSFRALAQARHADAVLVAPVFATASHEGSTPLGAMRLRMMAKAARRPVYALGGIDAHTVLQLRGTPLAGVAAVSALSV